MSKCRNQAEQALLSSAQNGYWPYHAQQQPSIEATAWCAIALRHIETIGQSVVTFLAGQQNADGGWSTAPGCGQSDWSSSLALLSLRILASPDTAIFDRGARNLMDHRANAYSPLAGFLVSLSAPTHQIDVGWPWNYGCYHWVEPTSYAVMALKPSKLSAQKEYKQALAQARSMLIKHACAGGGWNHGNNITLGAQLPPYVITTAQALIALQDARDLPVVESGLAYLRSAVKNENTVAALSWAILAFDAFNIDASNELTMLIKHQRADGSFGENLASCALATLALGVADGDNPLKFAD